MHITSLNNVFLIICGHLCNTHLYENGFSYSGGGNHCGWRVKCYLKYDTFSEHVVPIYNFYIRIGVLQMKTYSMVQTIIVFEQVKGLR